MKKFILLFLSLPVFFGACKKKSDSALWNIQALAPLVQTSLTLDNIIKDTAFVQKNADNSITVSISEEMANISTNSLVALNVTPYTKRIKLSSLVLNNQTIVRNITLGELARILQQDASPSNQLIGNIILSNHNGTIAFFPGITNLTAANLPLDVKQFFDDATFITGNMEIKIDNNLPVDIGNLDFNVKNTVAGTTLATQNFGAIAKNASVTQNIDLAGKTVEGNLLLNLLDLDLGGGVNVPIDTNSAIVLNVTINSVSLSAATAIFPEQNVLDETEDIVLEGMGEVELVEAWIESGVVNATITSTLKTPFDVTYSIPGATKNSVPFEITRTIPAKTGSASVVQTIAEDFSSYKMNLESDNFDTINTFSNRIVGTIPFTGQKVFITLDDSVDVVVRMDNPIPSYVKGYIGRDTFPIGPSTVNFDLFKNVESGTLNFEEASINLSVNNSLGIPGAVILKSVTAVNSRTGATVAMTGPSINSVLAINKATDNPLTPSIQTIDISAGSNAVDLLNILPDQFLYQIDVISNPGGNDMSYTDFAYSTGGLSASLDIELPLSFFASALTLADTVAFPAATLQKNPVNKGVFSVHADNGFPLSAALKVFMLDQNDAVIDSLTTPSSITAAPLNGSNRVSEKSKSIMAYDIDEAKMQNIYKSNKLIFKVSFTTEPVNTHLKLYSDYSIDFKLMGDMNYSVY